MILHDVEQVVAELNGTLAYDGSSRSEIHYAQKGIELVSSLQTTDCPEKWIGYCGHLTLALYHAPPFGDNGQRAMEQVGINLRLPSTRFEVRYLLPNENRPWEYVSGSAEQISDATTMIIDALGRCEQRDQHLYR